MRRIIITLTFLTLSVVVAGYVITHNNPSLDNYRSQRVYTVPEIVSSLQGENFRAWGGRTVLVHGQLITIKVLCGPNQPSSICKPTQWQEIQPDLLSEGQASARQPSALVLSGARFYPSSPPRERADPLHLFLWQLPFIGHLFPSPWADDGTIYRIRLLPHSQNVRSGTHNINAAAPAPDAILLNALHK